MHITHVNIEKTWRGGERQTLLLMTGLRELGISSSVICRAGHPLAAQATRAGFPTTTFLFGPRSAVGMIAAAREADILHAHAGRAHGLAAFLKLLTGKPLVVTRRVPLPPGDDVVARWKYRSVDGLVAVSEHIQAAMERWGYPPRAMRVIYSTSPEPAPLDPACRAKLRRDLGFRDGAVVVGTVAALIPEKGHRTLLEAARLLVKRGVDLRLLLVGDGVERAALERHAEALGLEDRALFTGFREDAAELTGLMDVFVLPSLVEGLGSAVVDAFWRRVPVIAAATGGLVEMVFDGGTGLLFPSGDAEALAERIDRLRSTPELARRLAEVAWQRARSHHTVGGMAAAYARLYEEILAGRGEKKRPGGFRA